MNIDVKILNKFCQPLPRSDILVICCNARRPVHVAVNTEFLLSQRSPLYSCALAFGMQVKNLSIWVKFLLVEWI